MKQKQRRSILARIVPENDRMYGIFRLSASAPRANLSSICGEFKTDLNFKLLQFPSADKLFFYGHEKDFKPNFRTRSEADATTKILFPTHLETHYSKKTPLEERNGIGYARISIEEMTFDGDWHSLVRNVLNYYQNTMGEILKKIILVKVPEKEMRAYKSMMGQFKKFPSHLADLALKHGFYYWIRKDDSLNLDRELQPIEGTASQIPVKKFSLNPKALRNY